LESGSLPRRETAWNDLKDLTHLVPGRLVLSGAFDVMEEGKKGKSSGLGKCGYSCLNGMDEIKMIRGGVDAGYHDKNFKVHRRLKEKYYVLRCKI